MSHKVSQSPSNASPTPDFTALASMFQDIAQVLLRYGKTSEAEMISQTKKAKQTEQTGHINQAEQREQVKQAEQTSLREQHIKFCYDTNGERTPAFRKVYGAILDSYRRGEFHDEIRCFLVSASNVRKEYELLNKYNCCYLYDFLGNTYDELSMIIKLLGHLDKEVDISATELLTISDTLSRPLENLQELQTQLENFKLIHTAIIPE